MQITGDFNDEYLIMSMISRHADNINKLVTGCSQFVPTLPEIKDTVVFTF